MEKNVPNVNQRVIMCIYEEIIVRVWSKKSIEAEDKDLGWAGNKQTERKREVSMKHEIRKEYVTSEDERV